MFTTSRVTPIPTAIPMAPKIIANLVPFEMEFMTSDGDSHFRLYKANVVSIVATTPITNPVLFGVVVGMLQIRLQTHLSLRTS